MSSLRQIKDYFAEPLTLGRLLQLAGFLAVGTVVIIMGIKLIPDPGAALRVLTHVGLVFPGQNPLGHLQPI